VNADIITQPGHPATTSASEAPEISMTDTHKKILIPGGTALVGTKRAMIKADSESPIRKQKLNDFYLDNVAVSNQRFAEFIEDTGYITDAERIGWSYVFLNHLPQADRDSTLMATGATWWRQVFGANWRVINGPDTEDTWQTDHPVVHVSHNDAKVFAKWAGGRLPIEAEWEHAARGGKGDVLFPWGDQEPDDEHFLPCNIWQGNFPHYNTKADGFDATAPVDAFEPNGYGLFNMVGNTWEWTAGAYTARAQTAKARKHAATMKGAMVLKGGSFMCHKSYCFRYRIAARSGNTADSTTSHMGFRIAYDT
jgi:formylglycine-generating enzyme required for sulfatase activity